MSIWLLMGGLVGVLNGLTRWWTVARLQAEMGNSAVVLTLGGLGIRLALVVALLIGGLRQGIVPGLLAFAGLWITRLANVIWLHASAGARHDMTLKSD
jgi:hypothetical protein